MQIFLRTHLNDGEKVQTILNRLVLKTYQDNIMKKIHFGLISSDVS